MAFKMQVENFGDGVEFDIDDAYNG